VEKFEMTGKLTGKVAVVTGGGGGIGKGIALLFAKQGAKVVVVNRSETGAQTVEEIEEFGGIARWIATDVGVSKQVQEMVGEVVDTFGKIDILVNNAAVQHLLPLWELPEEQFEEMLRINLGGYYHCSKYIIPYMMIQKKGNIINISSNLAFRALVSFSGYSATKGGIVSMSRTLALECAPYGIRVNCICPGSTITPILDPILETFKDPEAVLDAAGEAMPAGRLAVPADVAKLALFLASDNSEMILGTSVIIDGGASTQLPNIDTSDFEQV
jgi:NAD(P)-dependent dehydrogenase (short-subunit alcohol dehydrogenase family)